MQMVIIVISESHHRGVRERYNYTLCTVAETGTCSNNNNNIIILCRIDDLSAGRSA